MLLSFLASCGAGNGSASHLPEGDTIPMKYVTNLTMVDYGDFIKADFRNPWDTTRILQTYLLVPNDNELPTDLPQGTVVRTPLRQSVVYTSVHSSLIDELGSADAIAGVCDTRYIRNSKIKDLVKKGIITDCGATMSPNIEKIIQLRPDAIILSAFENSNDHNKVGQTGIPIIDCTDYMENSPLARAEWMKFFGRLYGKGHEADSIFAEVEKSYLDTKSSVRNVKTRPKVLTEMIYGQSWSVPAAYSTAGVLIEDAGGTNPFSSYKTGGSVQLAPEEVLYKGGDADIWLIKYSRKSPLTMNGLASENPIYSKFKAWKTGNVYGCDTDLSSLFDDSAFHPDRVLSDMMTLIHPEIGENKNYHHYYKKLEK